MADKSNELLDYPKQIQKVWAIIREHATTQPQTLHEKLTFLKVPDEVKVSFDENEEGLMNYIFRVQKIGDPTQRALVKNSCQHPVKINLDEMGSADAGDTNLSESTEKILDEGLPQDRMISETQALNRFNTIRPGSAPQIFLVDSENYFFIMEDLCKHTVLCKVLASQLSKAELVMTVTAVGECLAAIHVATHHKTLSSEDFDKLDAEIGTKEIQMRFNGFLKYLLFDSGNVMLRKNLPKGVSLDKFYKNERLRENGAAMLEMAGNKKDCLIHEDFHAGSVMVNGADIKFIDAEYSHVGAVERDAGVLCADLLSYHFLHKIIKRSEIAQQLAQSIRIFLETYMEKMKKVVDDQTVFLQNIAAFTGFHVIFRIIVAMTVPGLDQVPSAEVQAYNSGVRILQDAKNINSIHEFMSVALGQQ